MRGNREEKWIRGNGVSQGRDGTLRGWEEAALQQWGGRDNQQVNTRQTGGEASPDKRRWSVKRSRGGGGVTSGVTATNEQTRGKGEGGTSRLKSAGQTRGEREADTQGVGGQEGDEEEEEEEEGEGEEEEEEEAKEEVVIVVVVWRRRMRQKRKKVITVPP
jgi:hypothetical protein